MKAPDPDCIQNWVWLLSREVIYEHGLALFGAIITMGFIPPRWKVARTRMLTKPSKDDYTQPGSYRPIVLLNTITKIFEKALSNYMSQVAKSKQVLHGGHYGA